MDDVLAMAPPGIDTRKGSIFYDAVSATVNKIAKLYTDLDRVFELVFITTATENYLDLRAEEFGINTNAPMSWAEFKSRPKNLQKIYIDGILAKYAVGPIALSRMFKIDPAHCSKYLRALGVKFGKQASTKETIRFEREFCAAAREPVANESEVTDGFDSLSLTFSGTFSAEAIAAKLARFFPTAQPVKVTVEIVAV